MQATTNKDVLFVLRKNMRRRKPAMKGYVRDFITALKDQGLPADQAQRFANQVMHCSEKLMAARRQPEADWDAILSSDPTRLLNVRRL